MLEVMEVPLSYKKLRGGTRIQWIGYQLDVGVFEKGISDSKVKWILGWIEKKKQDGGATGRELKSALGRLSFVAGALQHIRPFLGPLFAWASALALGGREGPCGDWRLGDTRGWWNGRGSLVLDAADEKECTVGIPEG